MLELPKWLVLKKYVIIEYFYIHYLLLITYYLLFSYKENSILCSTFLVLLIHPGTWSLNEGWHIYKIVEPVILAGSSSANNVLQCAWDIIYSIKYGVIEHMHKIAFALL